MVMQHTKKKVLEVVFMTSERVIFEGRAARVIFPGEKGVFEVCAFHKSIISRLLPGEVIVDEQSFNIKHGIVKVSNDQIMAIVELAR